MAKLVRVPVRFMMLWHEDERTASLRAAKGMFIVLSAAGVAFWKGVCKLSQSDRSPERRGAKSPIFCRVISGSAAIHKIISHAPRRVVTLRPVHVILSKCHEELQAEKSGVDFGHHRSILWNRLLSIPIVLRGVTRSWAIPRSNCLTPLCLF